MTDNYLHIENDRLRRELEAMREERSQEREQMRQDMREEHRRSQCEAENWEDAFTKGLDRYRVEAATEVADNESIGDAGDPYFQPDFFFSEMVPKVEQAQSIYLLQMRSLNRVIERMKQDAREAIAKRIEEETGLDELAQAMRDDNHLWLVEW
jgi:hypothetical protein